MNILIIVLIIISGLCRGLREVIQFRYNNFKQVFPKINDLWWNPQISWKNKYEDGDPTKGEKFLFSTTLFVFVTDAFHFLAFLEHLFIFTVIGLILLILLNNIIGIIIGYLLWMIFSLSNNIIMKIFNL